MLLKNLFVALSVVSLGTAVAIPRPIEEGIKFPETKREVDNSVYLLSKRENEDGLYKKDQVYKDAPVEDGLYKKDQVYKDAPVEDGLYKKDQVYKKRTAVAV